MWFSFEAVPLHSLSQPPPPVILESFFQVALGPEREAPRDLLDFDTYYFFGLSPHFYSGLGQA